MRPKVNRVLRGGAFGNIHWLARCAARPGNHPHYGDWDGGFRVVVSPIKAG
jgi:formylglycine-generating enzyme required for sulfatase activity